MWMSDLNDGNEWPIIALLFTMLPNLEEIDFEDNHERENYSLKIIRRIADGKDPKALSRLKAVHFTSVDPPPLGCYHDSSLVEVFLIHVDFSGTSDVTWFPDRARWT